jgi:hypothetical protein
MQGYDDEHSTMQNAFEKVDPTPVDYGAPESSLQEAPSFEIEETPLPEEAKYPT